MARFPRQLGSSHILVVFVTLAALIAVSASVPPSSDAVTFAPRSRVTVGQSKSPLLSSATATGLSDSSGLSARGGASYQTKELGGALYFVVLDAVIRRVFKEQNIDKFPSQLAGCLLLFAAMLLVQVVRPGLGDSAFNLLNPGAELLAKWLPVFFVPGLAMLPLSPSLDNFMDVVKVLAVVIVGFFFSLSSTAFAVVALRNLQDDVKTPALDKMKAATNVPSILKPFSQETLDFLLKASVVSAAVSIGASRSNNQYSTPLRTIALGFITVASYVWSARLPTDFTKYVHPLVSSTTLTLIAMQLIGAATGSSFQDVLRSYKSGSLDPMKAGAGDILLFLLGPAVISFAVAMYSRRRTMADNLFIVLASMIVSSVGGVFGTAAFVRLINLGGAGGKVLRLSLLCRNITTALAIAMSDLIGGDMSLTASIVVLTGIFGATFGKRVLNFMGITDPIARGLGIGASAQGLGVASFTDEKEAFPFAAISMVLTAAAATTLVSIPEVKDVIVNLATGKSPIAK